MVIKKLILGMVETNCYIVFDKLSKRAVIIDSADSPKLIVDALSSEGVQADAVILTHGHFDHILGLQDFEVENIKIYAAAAEAELLADAKLNSSSRVHRPYTVIPDVLLEDGDNIEIPGIKLQVIATPGHTGGSICFYDSENKVLFSGDTLFYRSIGRTDLPTGSKREIIDSIRQKLFLLSDETKVYPGHGPETTIGYEKANNPYV